MRPARTVAATVAALTAHTLVNALLLRRPPHVAQPVRGRVSVLLPLRDEAHRVAPCLRALAAQRLLDDVELLVLDDGSSDGTGAVVARELPQARLLVGEPLPRGWLGKPWACQQLAAAATGEVLVFLDADVVLAPDGVARTVALLRQAGLGFVSPYPAQDTGSLAERVVQPLLQWSWLTFLPLRIAERSSRPSLAAANGQLLAVDAGTYRAAGGHAAARDDVVDDVALARALRAAGAAGGFAEGSEVARCRMYVGWPEVRAGYGKSLWRAFGSPAAGAAVAAGLVALYALPVAGAVAGRDRRAWSLAWLLGTVGRAVAAARTGGRTVDAAAHPLSVLVFAGLVAGSVRDHRRGRLRWKGRPL